MSSQRRVLLALGNASMQGSELCCRRACSEVLEQTVKVCGKRVCGKRVCGKRHWRHTSHYLQW